MQPKPVPSPEDAEDRAVESEVRTWEMKMKKKYSANSLGY